MLTPSGHRPVVRFDRAEDGGPGATFAPRPPPPCVWCGEPGWHGTTQECIEALALLIAVERRRLWVPPPEPIAPAPDPPTCPTCDRHLAELTALTATCAAQAQQIATLTAAARVVAQADRRARRVAEQTAGRLRRAAARTAAREAGRPPPMTTVERIAHRLQLRAIRAARVAAPLDHPRPPPKTVIDRMTKAAIVARMFEAAPRQIMTATRTLGAEYSIKPATIQTSWRRWATERDPIDA
jgi:hypothetical protein